MIATFLLKQQQHYDIMNVNVHECALCVCMKRGVHGMSLDQVCMSCVFDVACFQLIQVFYTVNPGGAGQLAQIR